MDGWRVHLSCSLHRGCIIEGTLGCRPLLPGSYGNGTKACRSGSATLETEWCGLPVLSCFQGLIQGEVIR